MYAVLNQGQLHQFEKYDYIPPGSLFSYDRNHAILSSCSRLKTQANEDIIRIQKEYDNLIKKAYRRLFLEKLYLNLSYFKLIPEMTLEYDLSELNKFILSSPIIQCSGPLCSKEDIEESLFLLNFNKFTPINYDFKTIKGFFTAKNFHPITSKYLIEIDEVDSDEKMHISSDFLFEIYGGKHNYQETGAFEFWKMVLGISPK